MTFQVVKIVKRDSGNEGKIGFINENMWQNPMSVFVPGVGWRRYFEKDIEWEFMIEEIVNVDCKAPKVSVTKADREAIYLAMKGVKNSLDKFAMSIGTLGLTK